MTHSRRLCARRPVVLLVSAALLAACGSQASPPDASPSAGSARSTTPATTAASVITAAMSPAEALDVMRRQLRAAGTGTYTERTVSDLGGGATLTRLSEGRFDEKRRLWAVHTSFEADPATSVKELQGVAGTAMDMVVSDGVSYMTMKAWPRKWRGRWLRLDTASAAGFGAGLSARPLPVAVLDSLRAQNSRPDVPGVILTGTLPEREALVALGLNSGLQKSHVKASALTGEGRFSLTVDERGLPTTMSVDGADVQVSRALGTRFRDAVARQTATVTFEDFGRPVHITVPKRTEVLDPGEMTP